MKPPKDGEKRWIHRKGCKNAAKMWRSDLETWVIVPMVVGKPVTYVTEKISLENLSMKPQSYLSREPNYAEHLVDLTNSPLRRGR